MSLEKWIRLNGKFKKERDNLIIKDMKLKSKTGEGKIAGFTSKGARTKALMKMKKGSQSKLDSSNRRTDAEESNNK